MAAKRNWEKREANKASMYDIKKYAAVYRAPLTFEMWFFCQFYVCAIHTIHFTLGKHGKSRQTTCRLICI